MSKFIVMYETANGWVNEDFAHLRKKKGSGAQTFKTEAAAKAAIVRSAKDQAKEGVDFSQVYLIAEIKSAHCLTVEVTKHIQYKVEDFKV